MKNWVFPVGLLVKNPPCNTRDMSLIPGPGRSPAEGNGNPLWYSCPGNPMDRGAWQATVHGVAKESDTTGHTYTHIHILVRRKEMNKLGSESMSESAK